MATHAGEDKSQELFENVGKKVEALQLGNEVDTGGTVDGRDDGRVVDEIESLCMNCQENVCLASSDHLQRPTQELT